MTETPKPPRPDVAALTGILGPLPVGVSSVDIVRAIRDRDNDFLDAVEELMQEDQQ